METTISSQEQEIDRFIGEIQSQTKTIQESYRKLLGEHQPFSKEILLLGETGVGKSTFLSWLMSSREHPLFAEERDDGRLVLKIMLIIPRNRAWFYKWYLMCDSHCFS